MAKHLIEDIKVGISGGGMACGPVSGSVVTEMQLRDTGDNSVMYYGITEVEGIENYLKSEESLYDTQISDNFDDTEAWDKVYAANIEDYDEEDPIWKLLYFFVRADWNAVVLDVREVMEKYKGKTLKEALEDYYFRDSIDLITNYADLK